jgi:hypothetical protein
MSSTPCTNRTPKPAPTVNTPDAFTQLCASLDGLSAALDELLVLIEEERAS